MKTIGTHKLRLLQKTGLKLLGLYLFNEKYKLVSLKKTTCITMSGHLSTEEKALFKAEIDAIRRKDYAFFIEF
jgi:hypothetical protein